MSGSMTSSHSIGSLETWEPEDKSFTKHILKEGQGLEKPNDGSICMVNILPVGDHKLEESDLAPYVAGSDKEVTIGEGDTKLSELLDKVVMSMKEGEMCYVKSKVDQTGKKVSEFEVNTKALKFNVSLASFSRSADSVDLEQDERLDRALHHKSKGTELYQNDNLEFSQKRFEKALQYLSDMEPVKDLPKDLIQQYRTLRCQCYLNMGACYLKRDKFEDVVEFCSKALMLDPDNVKGLFRKGQALTKLHNYEEAKVILNHALALDPENKAIRNQLTTVNTLVKREKQLYQKMFNSSKKE